MSIEPRIAALILLAALMHALWNALVKTSDNGLSALAAINLPVSYSLPRKASTGLPMAYSPICFNRQVAIFDSRI
jgi:hypothetical protein